MWNYEDMLEYQQYRNEQRKEVVTGIFKHFDSPEQEANHLEQVKEAIAVHAAPF